ncbi:MAG: hypothetical protein Kow0025_26540 [Thermodesulfovibrionales bacterium]
MADKRMAKKTTYMGAGVGLVLFAIFGLLPGSMLGGAMGLNIAGLLFGTPVTSNVLPRLIVGVSMLLGVMVAGIIFVFGSSLAGWLLGTAIDAVFHRKEAAEKAEAKS